MSDNDKSAPATGWRSSWVFLTVLFAFASLVETLGFGHLGAFTPLYLRQLGVAESDVPQWTGYLAAASFVIGLPLAPFWGIWADKYSRKMIIVRSAFGEAIIFLVAALSANVWHLLAARMLTGFILGNTGVMYAFVSDVAPKRSWGVAIATMGLGTTIGMSAGPLLGGFLVTQWGIKSLLILDAALSLLVALLLIGLLKENRAKRWNQGSTVQMLLSLGRSIVRMPVVLGLFATYAIVLLGAQISTPFVPILVDNLYVGADLPTAIGFVSAGFAIASAVFTPIWGRLGDRNGHRRVLAVAMIFLIPALVYQTWVADLSQLLFARAVQGVFQAAIAPLLMALVALHTPEERRASVLNLSLFPNYFAWIAGATAGAELASISIQSLFLAGAVFVLVGLAMLLKLAPEDKPSHADPSNRD
ncbi:MAG: MFS transporter [Dehalococcoidales bacterium]|nr:MFS transporter [Dehalococcoidales bacterium]